jgi:hypothetical protein
MIPRHVPSTALPDAAPDAAMARQRLFWRLGLGVPALVIGLWLRFSQHPWKGLPAKKLAKGLRLKFDEMVHIQLWWAGAVICSVLVFALLTSHWWLKWARLKDPGNLAVLPENAGPASRPGKKYTLCVIGVLLLAFLMRLPRMERGIDRDEQDTVRLGMIGYIPLDATGKPEGPPVVHPWNITVWECTLGNNPFLFSIAARCSVRTWQACTGAEPWRISLSALRLPALLAGLLGIAALIRLGTMAGPPGLGLLTGVLGALHPMHVEFSTQARGYAMVLLFVPLAMIFAWQGLRTGRWKHWLGLGGSLLGLLAANPGSIYFAAALGIFLTGFLILQAWRDPAGTALCALTRWLLCATLAGLLYLPLILPALPQATAFLKTMNGPLHGMWMQVTWAWYGGGLCYPPMEITTPWLDSGKTAWDFIRQGYFQTEPLTALFLVVIVPWLLWSGTRWWWSQRSFRPLLLAGIAAPLTAFLYHQSADTPFLYHWYLIYWLPPSLLLIAAALLQAGKKTAAWTGAGGWSTVPVVAYLCFFCWLIRPGIGRIIWKGGPVPQPEVYDRGRYQWTTTPDGTTYRQAIPGVAPKKR